MKAGLLLLPWALAGTVALAAPGPPPTTGGIVVEEVQPGSAAARAGIQPGDVLLAWERAASPPANPRPAAGTLGSPFDLEEVETEEAPRGPMRLAGRRHGEARVWELPAGDWDLTVIPPLQGALLHEYRRGRQQIAGGKTAAGIARWQRLAASFAAQGEPEPAAWLAGRIAGAQAKSGAWDAAKATYRKALSTVASRCAPPVVSKLQVALATILRDLRELAPAADLLGHAIEERRTLAPESLSLASLLGHLGHVSILQGDLRKGERELAESLALSRKLAPGSLAEAGALARLGIAETHLGDLTAADDLQNRALEIDQRLLPDSLDLALDFANLGNLERARGDLAAALEHFRQALALHERLAPRSLALAEALENVAAALLDQDDPLGAEEILRRSLALRQSLHAPAPSTVTDLMGLGTAAWAQHDPRAAELWLRQALAITEKTAAGSVEYALLVNNLANVLLDEGRPAEAEEGCRRALSILHELAPGSDREVTADRDLAVVLRRQRRLGEARELYLAALCSLEANGRRLGGTAQTRSTFLASYASYYREAVDLLVELGRPEEAFGILERYRAQGFLALLAERDLALDGSIPADLKGEQRSADAEHDRLLGELAGLQAGTAGEKEELQRQLANVRRRRDEIRQRIRAASPRLATLRDPQPLDLQATAAALDPGTLLLSYSVGRERSWLFAVGPGPGRFAVYPIAAGEEALRDDVLRLRALIEQGGAAAGPEGVLRAAASLTARLLAPAAREIAAADRLLVLPDGPLHRLPFAALADPGAPRFLVEAKPVHVAASATVWSEIKRDRREQRPVRLSAFGDPVYPASAAATAAEPALRAALRDGLRLVPLPATRSEVESLRSLFPEGAQVFLGSEATEERAKALGRAPSIVHFACHALVDERFPLDSALALTIPVPPRAGHDNGLLQAWEIFEQVRLDADLVTLSACDSGLGKELGGEGLIGLTRAFQYAGARSVLASLWSVADDSTAELMRRFYGYLKQGKSKDEALRAAQVELIHGPEATSHPYCWAAFQLSGDWR